MYFLTGFACGALCAFVYPRVPDLLRLYDAVFSFGATGALFRTTHAVLYLCYIQLEQLARRNVVRDANNRDYILSYVISGHLHKIKVRPRRGPPGSGEDDPFRRGYRSIVYDKISPSK